MKTVLLRACLKNAFSQMCVTIWLLTAAGILPYMTANAEGTADGSSAVRDEAGLFREEEVRELERLAQKYGGKAKVHYYILTKNICLEDRPYSSGEGIEEYTESLSEAFYDTIAAPSGNEDAVIFTIVMEYPYEETSGGNYTDRYADVSGQGYGRERLDDNRAQMVFDKIKSALSGDAYAGAMEKAMKISCEYMRFRPGIDPSLLIFRLWFQVLLCLTAGGIITGCMVCRSGGTVTVNNRTYLDAAHSKILARRDLYLRTTLQKTKKQSSNGGSGGGHHSSGHRSGGSHGGGHF